MKQILFSLAMSIFAFAATAQPSTSAPQIINNEPDYGQNLTIRIWDNTTAPHSNALATPEEWVNPALAANTSEAVLYIFGTDESKATGQSVVICPGGGYTHLAIEHEGHQFAKWLAAHGITAAVLKYRMPNAHREVPLEDVEQALRIMQGAVSIPEVKPYIAEKVGVAGFSAGGHLAATASTIGAVKPAFSILFYPVITGEAGKCHKGSFDFLLGKERTEELTAQYSLHNRVDAQTPPAILLLSDDDTTVPPISSTSYYNALKEQGTKASMHIYPTGGHGWGMRESFRYHDAWQAALIDWLKNL